MATENETNASAEATTATPATAATETTPSQETTTTATTDAKAAGSTESGSTASPDWREAIKTADRDELLRELLDSTESDKLRKDPKLAGIIGDAAERRARAKEAEIEQRIVERMERDRLKKLRDEDPYAYAQEEKRREEEAVRKSQEVVSERERFTGWSQEIDTAIAEFARTSLPEDSLKKLSGKRYEGVSYAQGLRQFVADVIEESKSAWVADERKKWEKDVLPALRKEALAEVNGGDSSPDVGRGSAPAGALTQDEWARNFRDKSWRKANKDRINEALSSNRIRPT